MVSNPVVEAPPGFKESLRVEEGLSASTREVKVEVLKPEAKGKYPKEKLKRVWERLGVCFTY